MKFTKHFKALLSFTIMLIFTSQLAMAQVTTATLSGTVFDDKSQAASGVSVKLENLLTGTKYELGTNKNGKFTIANLRAGGPYKLTATSVGFETTVINDLFLDLGSNNVDVSLQSKTNSLSAVTVTGNSKIFDNKRTGASTNISSRLLRALPSITRSADDYLRLTPSASSTFNGLSFAGRNGQYNNFSLDGAVFNNPFGLDAPTPGGQTSAQPISLDAIDQIQVNIAPYDVTQAGFTGAGVNTVTKSGTNKFSGTVYGYFRNQDLTGKKVENNKLVIPSLQQSQFGVSLGGALRNDKVFYFINYESDNRQDQASSYVAQNASNVNNSNTSRVLESDLQAVQSILLNKFGYQTGAYQGFTHDQKSQKFLAKIDWNINNVHKLSVTYNGLDASKDKPAHPSAIGRRGPDFTTLQFQNSGYEIINSLRSLGTELKSNFGSRYANKLRLVYTSFNDNRNPFSTPFPVVNISKNNVRYIIAGHEPFSINNKLNQDAFQATNNFSIYKKNHNITLGASFESFKFGNSFNLTGYGPALFGDIDINDFKARVPVSGPVVFGAYPLDVDVAYAKNRAAADKWTWYYLTVGQASVYAQDEVDVTKKLKLTYGLRFDKPVYMNASYSSPNMNADGTFAGSYLNASNTFQNTDNLKLFDANGNPVKNGPGQTLDNNRFPSTKILASPRIGFNYDVHGDKSLQLRGGSGLFTGRFPFVWLGNQIGNPFSFFYCVTDKNFKWPQVWRTNIGGDLKTKSGTIFTGDIAYTKDVNAMMVRNYKLGTPTQTLASGTGDTRSIYGAADQGTDNAYVFTNTKVGYQLNISLQAQKTFKNGLYAMAAYNFLVAKDASSISAEISSDAFDRNPILSNANKAILSPSLYGNTHRFITALSKKFNYKNNDKTATTISVFGSWTSGNRFAYVYGGDINKDGTSTNDLLYVPTDSEIDNMAFAPLTDVNGATQSAAIQRAALKSFIKQDKYLNDNRGKYTEKYGATTPMFSQIDMRVMQDLSLGNSKVLQFSMDVVNLGNMLNSNWGLRKIATTSGYFQPVSVNVTGNTPTYQFDPSLKSTFVTSPDLLSRWQVQFGIRYIF